MGLVAECRLTALRLDELICGAVGRRVG